MKKLVVSFALSLASLTASAVAQSPVPGIYKGKNSEAYVFKSCRIEIHNRGELGWVFSARDANNVYNFWVKKGGLEEIGGGRIGIQDALTFFLRDASKTNIYSNETKGVPAGLGDISILLDEKGRVLEFDLMHIGLDGKILNKVGCEKTK